MSQVKYKRIILIGGTVEIYKYASNEGIEILSIQKAENFNQGMANLSLKTFVFDYTNLNQTLEFVQSISKIHPIDCVISFTEDAQEITAKLNEIMGLPGIPVQLTRLVKDKSIMRSFINDFSPIKSRLVKTKREIIDFAKETNFPIILKPKDGVGSQGIKLINKTEDINNLILDNEMLIEEYLYGREFSVETISFDGDHRLISITEKQLFNKENNSKFVEEAHKVPANLNLIEQKVINEYVVLFLNKISLINGPAHTEIILTKNGPKVVETHTRPGGDNIPELVNLSYGINIYELTIDWFVMNKKPEINNLKNHQSAAIKFLKFKPGKIAQVLGVEEASQIKDVIRIELEIKIGDYIKPIMKSRDRSGYIIAIGKDSEQAYKTCEKAALLLEVIYEVKEEEL